MKSFLYLTLFFFTTNALYTQSKIDSTNISKVRKLAENNSYAKAFDTLQISKISLNTVEKLKLSIQLSNHMNRFKLVQQQLEALKLLDNKYSQPDNSYNLWTNSLSFMAQGLYEKALKLLHLLYKQSGKLKNRIDKGRIETEIGISYYKLGDYIQANDYLNRAISADSSIVSENTIRAKNYLANLYESEDNIEKSKTYFLETLEFYKDKPNPNSPIYAELLNDYGMTMYYSAPEKGLEYVLKGLKLRQSTYGNKHPMISESYNNLSLIYDALREYEEAELYALKGIQLELEINPNHSIAHVVSMDNISQLFEIQQKWKESIKWLKRASSYFDKGLTKESKHYLNVAGNLADAYFRDDNVKQGLKVLTEAIVYERIVIKKGNPDDGYIVNKLLRKLYELKRYDEAEAVFISEIHFKKGFYGKTNKIVGDSYESLGDKLLSIGEPQKALIQFQKASEIIEKNNKKKGAFVSAIWLKIASTQIQLNQLSEAIEKLKKVEILINDGLGNIIQQISCISLLCKSFHLIKEYDKALEYNQQLSQIVSKLGPQFTLKLTLLSIERAAILSLAGKYQSAQTIFKEIKSECIGQEQLEFSYKISLAQHYERSGNYEQVLQQSLSCLNFLELHNLQFKPINLIVLRLLGSSSSKLNKTNDAIKYLSEALDLTEILDLTNSDEYRTLLQELLNLSKLNKDLKAVTKYKNLIKEVKSKS